MEKLTLEQAKEQFSRIQRLSDDPETAHSFEDDLRSEFIGCISEGLYTDLNEMIEIAKTEDIDFPRWCA